MIIHYVAKKPLERICPLLTITFKIQKAGPRFIANTDQEVKGCVYTDVVSFVTLSLSVGLRLSLTWH